MQIKNDRQPNPNARKIHVATRVSNSEMQKVLEKAAVYTKGDVSKWIRHAALNYQPKKSELEK